MADAWRTALTEKALAAERRVGLLRLGVILIGTIAYPFLLGHEGTVPWLAYSVLAVAWAYAGLVALFQPYRRFPVLASSLYTTLSDSALLMLWIAATGGYHSPFWGIMFLSLIAIAYRFSLRPALLAWGLYAALYVGLVAATGEARGEAAGVLFVRVGYLGFATVLAGFISTQALEQMRARIETTRQAETESHLRAEATRSLSLLHATIESTADGLLVVDLDGRIASFNRRFAELWRIPQDVLDTKSDEAALRFAVGQLRDPEGFRRKVEDLYSQPLAESHDTLEFRDGRVFERYSRPQVLEGRPVGRVWSFRDVTERVRAQQEREANQRRQDELDRLKALDAFKSQFINTAAHELNTPLTPILLQVHVLRQSLQDPAQAESVDLIARNVKRLSELVSDLLDAARYQSGRLALDRQPVDVAGLVEECAASFAAIARDRGVALHAKVERRPLPAAADPRRLSQILYNLVGNACKFTPRGGTVSVRARGADGYVEVQVADSGVGIDPADMGRLFLPFSQLHGAGAGTGLGLYISKGIVEAHGGRIRAESAGRDRGSTFTFTVPALPAPRDGAAGGEGVAGAGAPPPP